MQKNARSARCDECLSASVYNFISPAVKPGHGFMILNLHWTPIWGLVSAASWYTAEFWSTTPVVLCVVGTTSTSVSARSTPQDVPLRLRLALRSPLTCRQQVNLAVGPSTSTLGTQVMTEVPVTTTYVMTFAPGKSVTDLHKSVREAFAFLRPSHRRKQFTWCARVAHRKNSMRFTRGSASTWKCSGWRQTHTGSASNPHDRVHRTGPEFHQGHGVPHEPSGFVALRALDSFNS